MILFQTESGQVKQGEAAGNAPAKFASLRKDLLTTREMLMFSKTEVVNLNPLQVNDHVNKEGTPEQKKAWHSLIEFFRPIIEAEKKVEGFWKNEK